MNCPSCGVALPADARFCIECGAELPQAANTGATVALRTPEDRPLLCRACGAGSPADADYCVRCGRHLADAEPPPLAMPHPLAPAPRIGRPRPAPRIQPVAHPRQHRRRVKHVGSAFFLIGLGLLFLLKLPFWPAILAVWGVSVLADTLTRGSGLKGFGNAFWLMGLALIFTAPSRYFMPGIIILVGMSIFFGMIRSGRRLP